MKVLIVGGGVAGLSLAGFFEKLGIEYRVVEKQLDQSHHGYAIGLWSNARKILEKLDLANNLDNEGTIVQFLNIRNGKGKLLKKINLAYFSITYGGYLLIKRASLISWLLSKVPENKISYGVTLKEIEQNKDFVTVIFSNGDREQYDLVVGADGVSSQVRQMIFSEKEYRKYINWRVWYAWIDNKNIEKHTITQYIEPKEYTITFNVGDKSLACFVTHINHEIWDIEDGRIERLKELFKEESVLIPSVLNAQKSGEILPTDLCEIKMNTFFKGRVVLMGDAAHGFEPFAGIGSSMALEDAYILASELFKNKDLNLAFRFYQNKRKKRVEKARNLTSRMQAWGTVQSKLLRNVINIFMPYFPSSIFIKSYSNFLKEDL